MPRSCGGTSGWRVVKPLTWDLVDDGVVPGNGWRRLLAPGEGRVDDHAEWRVRGTVPVVTNEIAFRPIQLVPERFVAPLHRPTYLFRVRI